MPGSVPVAGARLIGTVHDSIVGLLPADHWEEVAEECMDRMINGVLPILKRMDCDFDVPLAAEVKVGTRWGLKDVGEIG
jgi:DNA polymerase I-like protein with 3'-5' exonuclease and polymerase domains